MRFGFNFPVYVLILTSSSSRAQATEAWSASLATNSPPFSLAHPAPYLVINDWSSLYCAANTAANTFTFLGSSPAWTGVAGQEISAYASSITSTGATVQAVNATALAAAASAVSSCASFKSLACDQLPRPSTHSPILHPSGRRQAFGFPGFGPFVIVHIMTNNTRLLPNVTQIDRRQP